MVIVEGLSKTYQDPKKGKIVALDGVSWSAEPGQVFGLLGANGAGKTTLMRILATLIQPDSGSASVAGHHLESNALEVRQNLGFLSGTTGLYGRLTIRECLLYFAGLYGISQSQAKQRADELITRFGMEEFAGKLTDRLSTGQKQRASIARAVMHDPPVLLFDEPTSGLDVLAAQAVMEFIEEEKTRGKTIIYSTHIMSEAERLCNRAAIIHEGQLVALEDLSAIYERTGETRLELAFLKLVGYSKEAA